LKKLTKVDVRPHQHKGSKFTVVAVERFVEKNKHVSGCENPSWAGGRGAGPIVRKRETKEKSTKGTIPLVETGITNHTVSMRRGNCEERKKQTTKSSVNEKRWQVCAYFHSEEKRKGD